MLTSARPSRIAARGFWLPIGQANFFRHSDDALLMRKDLLGKENNLAAIRDADAAQNPERDIAKWLQVSVYRRLVSVLPDVGYSTVIPLVPDARQAYEDDSDPYAAIFLCHPKTALEQIMKQIPAKEQERQAAILSLQSQPTSDTAIESQKRIQERLEDLQGKLDRLEDIRNHLTQLETVVKQMAFIISIDGFYLWLAVLKDEAPTGVLAQQSMLEEYVSWLAGGAYFSHFSGSPHAEVTPLEYEKTPNLKDYSEKRLGILNFFQINTLLEGLYNSTFDPQVFFSEGTSETDVERIKKQYSLGRFIGQISALTKVEQGAGVTNATSVDLGRDVLDLTPLTPPAKLYILLNYFLSEEVRRDLLRQFLRYTANESLQAIKWRIERCRRALLGELIEITQRREELLQVEVPDDDPGIIRNVTESQLRGYVMLLAAKMPLIENVKGYLEQAYDGIKTTTFKEALARFYGSWMQLARGIRSNIRGLERAIEQERMDRMVTEEERLRAEQETIAEIERISAATGLSITQERSLTINVIANVIAVIAAFAAALSLLQYNLIDRLQKLFQQLTSLAPTVPFGGYLALLIVGLIGVIAVVLFGVVFYFAMDFVLGTIIVWAVRIWRTIRGKEGSRDERFYYEMDISLNLPMTPDRAEALLWAGAKGKDQAGATAKDHPDPLVKKGKGRWEQADNWKDDVSRKVRVLGKQDELKGMWPAYPFAGEAAPAPLKPFQLLHSYHIPKRYSYRVERFTNDQALHKIYIGTTIRWRRRLSILHIPIVPRQKMKVALVYEILYHFPSSAQSYVLQDLRIATTHWSILSPQQLLEFKTLAIVAFINSLLEDEEYHLTVDAGQPGQADHIEPLVTLNVVRKDAPNQSSSSGATAASRQGSRGATGSDRRFAPENEAPPVASSGGAGRGS